MGRYDMIVEIMAKDRHEFLELYSKFHKQYYENILTKEVGVTTELFFMNKKWLFPGIGKPEIANMVGRPENLVDEKDIKILSHLLKNGRDPVKRIAQNLKMPATTVSQRIANLVKRGVIAGFRTDVDLKKFDRVYCKSFVYYSQANEKDVSKMIEYCFSHPDIIFITKCIAPWDMEIEANTHTFNDFTLLMNDLKNRFPNVVRNFEAAVINKDTSDLCKPRD
jgi:DNA-binding Lrp family transcriptional regulator